MPRDQCTATHTPTYQGTETGFGSYPRVGCRGSAASIRPGRRKHHSEARSAARPGRSRRPKGDEVQAVTTDAEEFHGLASPPRRGRFPLASKYQMQKTVQTRPTACRPQHSAPGLEARSARNIRRLPIGAVQPCGHQLDLQEHPFLPTHATPPGKPQFFLSRVSPVGFQQQSFPPVSTHLLSSCWLSSANPSPFQKYIGPPIGFQQCLPPSLGPVAWNHFPPDGGSRRLRKTL
ncbi:MAG: hypothetical protein ACI8U4_000478 [Natronomonas sp.]|jgi:hypothetical protein